MPEIELKKTGKTKGKEGSNNSGRVLSSESLKWPGASNEQGQSVSFQGTENLFCHGTILPHVNLFSMSVISTL